MSSASEAGESRSRAQPRATPVVPDRRTLAQLLLFGCDFVNFRFLSMPGVDFLRFEAFFGGLATDVSSVPAPDRLCPPVLEDRLSMMQSTAVAHLSQMQGSPPIRAPAPCNHPPPTSLALQAALIVLRRQGVSQEALRPPPHAGSSTALLDPPATPHPGDTLWSSDQQSNSDHEHTASTSPSANTLGRFEEPSQDSRVENS
eukprot:CAMPEP_0177755612 /NCGR_PEP_ID=MMETSP0491_2-20121128/2658_1 /TAXON_ID=63592 /ORGANISM="Tetraselmis chuii, Strain PLY429" /LENGTH=200 /DNA_ID=CAMNT_0019271119 /DNA_START=482 /DNA_END=1085 /DNA_ORIENTATION=+